MTDNLLLKWDPKSLEIRTITMEKTLEPLVLQVTTLVNTKCPSKLRKGKSKRASVLVSTVERATENFVKIGKLIAYENKDITNEMLCAVEEVRVTGLAMSTTSREFSEDPCSSLKRGNMVRAARGLLSAVTRLLIMADMADVHLLLKSLNTVENDFENLLGTTQLDELNNKMHSYRCNINNLMHLSAKRQQELIDPAHKEELAAARAVLKKHSTMLVTASKVYVNHPELTTAQSNRDYVFKQMCEAVRTINDVARGIRKQSQPHEEPGELATALDLFDKLIEMEPLDYNEITTRPSLEERLENIISRAALMADSSSTRDERRERIVMECNAVRQALQDLLTEYMKNMGKTIKNDNLITATDNLRRQTKALRRQLRKAVIDHVSDCFLLTSEPLVQLIKSAQDGNEHQVEGYATVFTEVSNKLIDVANMACSISNNEDGVKMVRYAAAQINQLYPEVISAARVLAARTRSVVAQDNMDAFHYAFEQQVRTLVEAVDDITAVDDFLAVTENHILEDVNKCIVAMQESDYDNLERNASGIIGRSTRICSMVTAEMDNYEPCVYTHRVLEAVKVLNKQIMPKFEQKISAAVTVLSTNGEIDEFDFVDSSRLVYDGLREIRRAVLMNRDYEDLDPEDVELDENYSLDTRSKSSADTGKQSVDEYPDIIGITTARDAMRKMPEEDRQKIMEHVEYFKSEKIKFDQEISKWDDSGNDIIILAKHMCMILMEMTDFTRGRGPLKTTMDVINAARRISEAGTKLDKLTREIAEQCPESSTKNDLLAYLQRIALYCHQMNITSKVKADVQNISGELIVSGLDSATSLIESAKNLMSAVVLTVKASYVASTKYTRHGTVASSIVVWKMKVPEKKPLVRLDKPEETRAKVRKGTQQKLENHLQALCEFHSSSELI